MSEFDVLLQFSEWIDSTKQRSFYNPSVEDSRTHEDFVNAFLEERNKRRLR